MFDCTDRSASITGRVQDVTGAVVAGVRTELRPESDEIRVLTTTNTDAFGSFNIGNLTEGNYVLRLMSPGFKWLTIKSIYLSEGEHKALPTLELSIGEMASCGGRCRTRQHAATDAIGWPRECGRKGPG